MTVTFIDGYRLNGYLQDSFDFLTKAAREVPINLQLIEHLWGYAVSDQLNDQQRLQIDVVAIEITRHSLILSHHNSRSMFGQETVQRVALLGSVCLELVR